AACLRLRATLSRESRPGSKWDRWVSFSNGIDVIGVGERSDLRHCACRASLAQAHSQMTGDGEDGSWMTTLLRGPRVATLSRSRARTRPFPSSEALCRSARTSLQGILARSDSAIRREINMHSFGSVNLRAL